MQERPLSLLGEERRLAQGSRRRPAVLNCGSVPPATHPGCQRGFGSHCAPLPPASQGRLVPGQEARRVLVGDCLGRPVRCLQSEEIQHTQRTQRDMQEPGSPQAWRRDLAAQVGSTPSGLLHGAHLRCYLKVPRRLLLGVLGGHPPARLRLLTQHTQGVSCPAGWPVGTQCGGSEAGVLCGLHTH